MPTGRARVDSYAVDVRPFQLQTNGTLDRQKRVIHLVTTPSDGPDVTGVFLSFVEGVAPTEPGRVVNTYLMINLSVADFADLYTVLQTESPIRIEYDVDADGLVRRFRLGALVPEPPGEGVGGDQSA